MSETGAPCPVVPSVLIIWNLTVRATVLFLLQVVKLLLHSLSWSHNHQIKILLIKIKYHGLQQNENNWFQFYLISNRKEQVYLNGVASESCSFSAGVPQGSIPGPFL